jgi:hypothetical protein
MSNGPGRRLALSSLLIAGLLVGDAAGRTSRHAGPTGVQQISEPAAGWHLRYATEPAAADSIALQIIPTRGGRAWLFVTDRRRPATSLLRWNTPRWNPVGSLPEQLGQARYVDVRASASGGTVLVINHVPGKWDSSTHHLWQFSGGRWTHHRPRHLDWASDFAVVDQDDAWFAHGGDPEAPTGLAHWDGTAWRRHTPPVATDLTTVAAAGSDDVWVVDNRGWSRTLHWDGRRWRDVPFSCTPALTQHDCHVSSLASGSRNDAWAVGPNWADGGRPVVLHWSGAAWNQVKLNVNRTALAAVRTDPVGGVWIAANPAGGRPYVLNLRNGKWTRATLSRSEPSARIVDIAPAPGTTCLWVHAQYIDGPEETSLIYELQ